MVMILITDCYHVANNAIIMVMIYERFIFHIINRASKYMYGFCMPKMVFMILILFKNIFLTYKVFHPNVATNNYLCGIFAINFRVYFGCSIMVYNEQNMFCGEHQKRSFWQDGRYSRSEFQPSK